jgi:hypothetical protein
MSLLQLILIRQNLSFKTLPKIFNQNCLSSIRINSYSTNNTKNYLFLNKIHLKTQNIFKRKKFLFIIKFRMFKCI